MTRRNVADDIAGAAPPAPPTPPSRMGARFEMRLGGLYKKGGQDDRPDLWICAPFETLFETRDAEQNAWGLLLRWRDRDGRVHEDAIPRAMFAGDSAELRSRLADGGLTLSPRQDARQALTEYLATLASPHRAVCVPRGGWHVLTGRRVFVLPDETFGTTPERVILQTAIREPLMFGQGGTPAGWRAEIAARCVGNSRLALAACAGFAAPLLDLLGEDGGGFHLNGRSRAGKTTLLRVAASVIGGTIEAGAAGCVRTWRSTGNAIEGTAATHCDVLLPLDEIGQADGRDIGETAYMLGNGQGKSRMDRGASMRAPLRFRTLFLSTGEQTLAAKISEAGKLMRAGMEIRMLDLPAEPQGRGVFEAWPIDGSPEALARALAEAVRTHYGTPLRGFLHHVVKLLEAGPEFVDELRAEIERRVTEWLAPFPAAEGQVRTPARRFALLAQAGLLATEAGITGWPTGEAERACRACFLSWLDARGTTGAREEQQAIEQLRSFVSLHGNSRFEDWKDPTPDTVEGTVLPPIERFRTVNRAGWRRWDATLPGWRYYLTTEGMQQSLVGLDYRASLALLAERGFIVTGPSFAKDRRASKPVSVPGYPKKMRLYEVATGIIGATGDPEDGPPGDNSGGK